jgi:hypothetical protein
MVPFGTCTVVVPYVLEYTPEQSDPQCYAAFSRLALVHEHGLEYVRTGLEARPNGVSVEVVV